MNTNANTSTVSHSPHRLFFMTCVALFLCIILFVAASITYTELTAYSDNIFHGITVGSIDASGLTKEELIQKIESASETIKRQGVEAHYQDISRTPKTATVPLEHISFQSDIPLEASNEIFTIDTKKTAEQAYAQGRSGTFLKKYSDRISFLFIGYRVAPEIHLNQELFVESLKKELISFESPTRDASFSFDQKKRTISIEPEQSGSELDSKKAISDTLHFLRIMERPRIILTSHIHQASLSAENLIDFKYRAQQLIENAPFTLSLDTKTWHISPELLVSWLTIEKNESGNPILSLNKALVVSYIEEVIAPKVHIEAKTARFEMKDGKVGEFEQQQNGEELDSDQSVLAILSGILKENKQIIPLVIKETHPPLVIDENQPLVRDILATAETDFKGSPKNRIFNITLGAHRIHGVLIEPGKEFSLISFLGKIDEKSGFLPELVIKGSKTMPEFGGGLCQVSTTLFRTVATAGLPILERRNHSYRVSYYEPPVGFDATVYYPKPDFRFANDTGSPILIQTAVKGTKIKMTLWGIKDGRNTEIDAPIVSNRKPAGPIKIVETDTLKPGEKKCTEHAHAGADAIFERRIVYLNGETKKDTFKSHYVVWPAVCLVGKQTDETGTSETTTSTSSSVSSLTSTPVIEYQTSPLPSPSSTQKKTPE